MNISIDKKFTQEEIIPANSLRTLSQKNLLELLNKTNKLGIIVNNSPEIAMVKWEQLDQLLNTIQYMEQKIEELEELLDDKFLSEAYGRQIDAAEKGETKSFEIDTVEDLFRLID